MARRARGITEAAIRNMRKPEGKRPARIYDGGGLFLYRTKKRRVWKLRYSWHGQERWLTLGEYPAMGLKAARVKAGCIHNGLLQGIDPKPEQPRAQATTFENVARRWLDHAGRDWAEKTRGICRTWFETDVFPRLGRRPPDAIEPPDVLALLRRIEADGNLYKVRRLHSYIRRVFSFAISHGEATRNPAGNLNVNDLFAREQRTHRPAFTTAREAGALMRMIEDYPQPVTRGALKMLALTLSRPGEVRAMRWDEIDRERAQWRYTVTKTRTPHTVPLPRQALAILDELKPLTGRGDLVFPGLRGRDKPISNNTLNAALRYMGIDTKTQHCAHGFRAMGRTLLAEMGYRPEAIERQLCHKQANDTVAAYAREKLLDERTKMMQHWADYLDSLRDGAKVVPIKRGTV